MVSQEVLAYIRNQRGLGVAQTDIAKMLATGGWTPQDIADAFAVVDGRPIAPPPPPPPPQPVARPTPPPSTYTPMTRASMQQMQSTPARSVPATPMPKLPQPRKKGSWLLVFIILLLLVGGGAGAVYMLYPSVIAGYVKTVMQLFTGAPYVPTPVEQQYMQPAPVATTTNNSVATTTSTTSKTR